MTQEEVLKGGNVNHIVRKEDTVLRPTGYWSPSVHELLEHLEKQGFEGAPRFLGIDDSDREILTFISGVVPGNDYPELEPYMWSDETLIHLARLLRRFHDATEGSTLVKKGQWQLTYVDDREHEVICHNDAALYNVVFQKGTPVSLIDFDMAGPGPRMWDIAYSLYTSVPLASFSPDHSSGKTAAYQLDLHAAERRRRIHLFFKSYGISVPNDLSRWIIQRLATMCDTLRTGAAEGNLAFQKMIDEGHLAHYEREIQFVTDHFNDWVIKGGCPMNNNKSTEMNRSLKAETILSQINSKTMLGDLRKIAKDIKKDHELAMELWSTEEFLPRLLAILIMDKNYLSQDVLNKLDKDMQIHTFDERNNLMDWLMANQLTKAKKTIALMESWEHSPSALQRRAFWYYKGRLRWTGQTPPDNNADLLSAIEATITQEEPEVQWAMNFTAGWIGIYDQKNRARCIKLGEKTGLYKDDMVSKGCTPNYLPEFIAIEVNKRNNK